jgi:tRNA(Arg) A34 adenosine deaminase TadA
MNIESIMKYTCDLAVNGIDMGSGPFASVIVDENGSIVGEGNNMVTMQNDTIVSRFCNFEFSKMGGKIR